MTYMAKDSAGNSAQPVIREVSMLIGRCCKATALDAPCRTTRSCCAKPYALAVIPERAVIIPVPLHAGAGG